LEYLILPLLEYMAMAERNMSASKKRKSNQALSDTSNKKLKKTQEVPLNGRDGAAQSTSSSEQDDGDVAGDDTTPVSKTFADLGVTESLCDACASLDFKAPTAIQSEAIPIALSGRDIIGTASVQQDFPDV
jgi:ATP-dependent RNA helicase DDX47/RRP3